MPRPPPRSPLFPYTTLFRSPQNGCEVLGPCLCVPGPPIQCYSGPPGTLWVGACQAGTQECIDGVSWSACDRSEEHTSELQSRRDLVCRLLLEKKKKKKKKND